MGQTAGWAKWQWDKLPAGSLSQPAVCPIVILSQTIGQNASWGKITMGQTAGWDKQTIGQNASWGKITMGQTASWDWLWYELLYKTNWKWCDCRLGQSNNWTGTNCRWDKMAMGQTANEAKWCQSVVVDGIWLSGQTCIDICKSVVGSLPFSYLFVVLSCLFVVVDSETRRQWDTKAKWPNAIVV